jgi:hypothetical protein
MTKCLGDSKVKPSTRTVANFGDQIPTKIGSLTEGIVARSSRHPPLSPHYADL